MREVETVTRQILEENKRNLKSKRVKQPTSLDFKPASLLSPEQLVLVMERLLAQRRIHWRTVEQIGAEYAVESAANADVAHRYKNDNFSKLFTTVPITLD